MELKKITQEEYDAIPRNEKGRKYCPCGDYTAVKNFGAGARFAEVVGQTIWTRR